VEAIDHFSAIGIQAEQFLAVMQFTALDQKVIQASRIAN
jgi:hypothetical protein